MLEVRGGCRNWGRSEKREINRVECQCFLHCMSMLPNACTLPERTLIPSAIPSFAFCLVVFSFPPAALSAALCTVSPCRLPFYRAGVTSGLVRVLGSQRPVRVTSASAAKCAAFSTSAYSTSVSALNRRMVGVVERGAMSSYAPVAPAVMYGSRNMSSQVQMRITTHTQFVVFFFRCQTVPFIPTLRKHR